MNQYPVLMTLSAALMIQTLTASPKQQNPSQTEQKKAEAVSATESQAAKPQVFTYPNGLTLIVEEDHSAPVASVQAWCKTGSIHEG